VERGGVCPSLENRPCLSPLHLENQDRPNDYISMILR
jgi:hypothetical protein